MKIRQLQSQYILVNRHTHDFGLSSCPPACGVRHDSNEVEPRWLKQREASLLGRSLVCIESDVLNTSFTVTYSLLSAMQGVKFEVTRLELTAFRTGTGAGLVLYVLTGMITKLNGGVPPDL